MRLRISDGSGSTEVEIPLGGLYNAYNVTGAVAAAAALGIPLSRAATALAQFKPAFGRMEKVSVFGKPAYLLLAKNPTGANEVLKTALDLGNGRVFLLALNDRVADGRDVSWIWDVDFEQLSARDVHLVVTGERAADLAVRLKYAGLDGDRVLQVSDRRMALKVAADLTPDGQTLFILPTYTALLELRRILSRLGAVQPYWRSARAQPKP
jgi:UDP-N-acetylmuramyl tripeptide synthase